MRAWLLAPLLLLMALPLVVPKWGGDHDSVLLNLKRASASDRIDLSLLLPPNTTDACAVNAQEIDDKEHSRPEWVVDALRGKALRMAYWDFSEDAYRSWTLIWRSSTGDVHHLEVPHSAIPLASRNAEIRNKNAGCSPGATAVLIAKTTSNTRHFQLGE